MADSYRKLISQLDKQKPKKKIIDLADTKVKVLLELQRVDYGFNEEARADVLTNLYKKYGKEAVTKIIKEQPAKNENMNINAGALLVAEQKIKIKRVGAR